MSRKSVRRIAKEVAKLQYDMDHNNNDSNHMYKIEKLIASLPFNQLLLFDGLVEEELSLLESGGNDGSTETRCS